MAQNEDLRAREHDGAKDDGSGLEAGKPLEMRGYVADLVKSQYRRREN